jgi:tetratricopeptide (TPR) repeat protein
LDEAGIPFLNEVVWDMLDKRAISAAEFGRRLGKLTRKNKQPYTKSRVYQMLRDNSFPADTTRRWVIAKLLQIPPILMGVKSLDDLLPLAERRHPTTSLVAQHPLPPTHIFDIAEYTQALKTYWQHNRQQTLSPFIGEIDARIHWLEWEFLYGAETNQKQVAELLCGYHILRANNARDLQEYDTAIDHFNQAYTLAKNNKLKKLQAGILCRRGGVFKERGEEVAVLHDFAAAQRDFSFATNDFTLALTLDRAISPIVQGSLVMSLGRLQADTAQTAAALHQSIKEIEGIETIVGKNSDGDTHFVEVDEERYYLNRAAAYLASSNPLACYPRDARRELRNAVAVAPTPLPKRRHAYNMVLEAKSYMIEGQAYLTKKRLTDADDCFSQATRKATEAIAIVKDIDSQVNVTRIEKICADLRVTPFGKENIDLASLEVEITSAKYPQLFQ